ncbi:MAG: hypothetical protein EA340_03125 [Nitriliruptor sp.]|nr:MAG: hypothetical protein EA340_03125 [Nitriliruptor sp.]
MAPTGSSSERTTWATPARLSRTLATGSTMRAQSSGRRQDEWPPEINDEGHSEVVTLCGGTHPLMHPWFNVMAAILLEVRRARHPLWIRIRRVAVDRHGRPMTDHAQTLLREALALSEVERAALIAELLVSLEGPAEDDGSAVDQAWAEAFEQRARRVLAGEASAELEAAALRHEAQWSGLGLAFLAAVDRSVEHLAVWPDAGVSVPGVPASIPVRQFPISSSPYRIAYMVTSQELRVLAVAHARRRPGYWHARPEPGCCARVRQTSRPCTAFRSAGSIALRAEVVRPGDHRRARRRYSPQGW